MGKDWVPADEGLSDSDGEGDDLEVNLWKSGVGGQRDGESDFVKGGIKRPRKKGSAKSRIGSLI